MKQKKLAKTRLLTAVCYLFAIALSSAVSADNQSQKMNHKRIYGLSSISSSYSAQETSDRLQAIILARGLAVVAVVDHAANAANVGLELRPTTLILFGSATIGTQLMQSAQTVGIDVPLKFLVWDDENGKVRISYNSADFIKHRHRVTDKDDVFDTISGALASIAAEAANLDE